MKTRTIEYRPLSTLTKLPGNPRTIKKADFEKLKKSVKDNPDYFEARPLILSDRTGEMVIIAGNQRYDAAKSLGMTEAPTILLSGLSEEREREIIIRDNVSNGEWDLDVLESDWNIEDLNDWGVNLPQWNEDTTEYQKFVDKFKPKLTTDDCYTPPKVFEAVEKWVRDRYEIGDLETIRPFKPDGDYQAEDYSGKVVIDNPPFSIESEIIRYYMERKIKFFLWAPHLTIFGCCPNEKIARIISYNHIVYENGAIVPTAFLTNLEPENVRIVVPYDLSQKIEDAQPKEISTLTKYARPKNCKITSDFAASIRAQRSHIFTDEDVSIVKNLDRLKAQGKALYGGGVLLTDDAAEKLAADKLAADKLAADKEVIRVDLSDREKEIVRRLNERSRNG